MKIRTFLFVSMLSYMATCEAAPCSTPYSCKRELPTHVDIEIYLQTLQTKGLGYPDGYSTVGFQLSPPAADDGFGDYFIDARAHYFNDNKWAANLGFGLRDYFPKVNKIIGINAFYDFRQIYEEYHQVGLGVELLGCQYDIRVNGYLPIASTRFFGKKCDFTYPGGYFLSCQGYRRALPGFDVEIGASLACYSCFSSLAPYVGIGPYFYHQKNGDSDIWGGKARIGATINKSLMVEARVSCDKVYGTNFQGFFSYTFSLGKQPVSCDQSLCCDPWWESVIHQPIQRQEIIVDSKKCCKWCSNF